MPTDGAKLNEPVDRLVTDPGETGPVTATDRTHPPPIGTWTIDPGQSSISFAWRKLRFWTSTGRLHCLGIIHLDDLPPVGVIQFEQPSGLPVLTIALDPASVETRDADLDAILRGPDVLDIRRHRWWTLRSESLEILPTGGWRVMAILTANSTPGLVELILEVDPGASERESLVLRGTGVLDRRTLGIAGPASSFDPQIRLDLVLRARRAITGTSTQRHEQEKVRCTTSMPG
jgi:polyisoprenoid-binding protein YceI